MIADLCLKLIAVKEDIIFLDGSSTVSVSFHSIVKMFLFQRIF